MEETRVFDLIELPWDEIQGILTEQYVGIVEEEFSEDEKTRELLISMEVTTIKYILGIDADEAREQEFQEEFWLNVFEELNVNLHDILIRDYLVPPDVANTTFVAQVGQPNRAQGIINFRCCRWIDCDGDGIGDTRACG